MNSIIMAFAAALMFSACTAQEKKATGLALDENTKLAIEQDSKAKALYAKIDEATAKGEKVAVIAAYLNFGNYMMFESQVPPRQKYRPALRAYNKTLELQPDNPEALKNKKTIEDIYTQMGLPIPKD
jgi:tetratricopeptide (TPR) repeat protein